MSAHPHVEELIAAYAIGALEDDERRSAGAELLDHLATCAPCRDLYRELRDVTTDLGLAVDPVPVPAELTQRVMDSIRGVPRASARARASRAPLRWRAAAAVAVAMIGALGVWNVVLTGDVHDLRTQSRSRDVAVQLLNDTSARKTLLTQTNGRGTIQLAVRPDGKAVLVGTNLPALPAGRVLELWLVSGGHPRPSVTFTPDAGPAVGARDLGAS